MRWLATLSLGLVCSLGACGGGSGSTPTPAEPGDQLAIVEAVGGVELPPGLNLDPTTLTVIDILGSAGVDASGGFALEAFEAGPILAFVRNAAGEDVLLGWFGGTRRDLSARSTAEVLLYYFAGQFMVPPEGAGAVLDEVAASDEIGAVEVAVRAAYAAGATTIEELIAAVGPALRDAAASLVAPDPGVPPTQQGVLINPIGARSGIAVDSVGFDDVQIQNTYRRRAWCWVDRVGYTPEGQALIPDPQSLFESNISASPGVSSLFDLFSRLGTSVWTPVVVGPVPIPLTPEEAYSTSYEVTVVGLGLQRGDYDRLSDAQKIQHGIVAVETVVIDIFLSGVVSLALPKGGGGSGDRMQQMGHSIATFQGFRDLARDLAIKSPELVEKVLEGDLRGALAMVVTELVKKPENFLTFTLALQLWVETYLKERANASAVVTELMGSFAAGPLSGIDTALSIADVALQALHIKGSNNADVWEIETTGAKVSLTPKVQVIVPGEFKTYTAVVQNAQEEPGLALLYSWTCDDMLTMVDGNGNTGTSFESTSDSVQLTPEPGVEGQAMINVEVVEVRGVDRQPVGKARARADIHRAKPLLTPSVSSLLFGESIELEAKLFPEPLTPPDQLAYVFTCPEVVGQAQGSLGEQTATPWIRYTAGSTVGTETMTVEVFEVRNGVASSLGTATAEIRVELRKSVLQASYQIDVCPREMGRASVSAVVPVSPPVDAKTLRLRGEGGNDPWFYGSSITITASKLGDGTWNTLYGDCGSAHLPDEHFALSGGTGPASDVPDSIAWFQERFDDFSFRIEVTYE